tara:strand:+ start:13240 stop:13494 length:255 start_codon:yes stop_codon:yes gene_type:complete
MVELNQDFPIINIAKLPKEADAKGLAKLLEQQRVQDLRSMRDYLDNYLTTLQSGTFGSRPYSDGYKDACQVIRNICQELITESI